MNMLFLDGIRVLAQAAGGAPAGGGMGSMLLMVLVLILLMWFMGSGQRKQAKKEKEFREKMQKGDRVTFSGGIYGKVHSVDTTTIEVEVSNGVIMTVEKSMVQPAPASNSEEKK